MKGRYIGANLRILFELLDYTDKHAIPGMIFSDFEKAFDSVDHHYLFECLKHFNFSDSCINLITLFYNDEIAVYQTMVPFPMFSLYKVVLSKAVPSTPYLFIICIELLS